MILHILLHILFKDIFEKNGNEWRSRFLYFLKSTKFVLDQKYFQI